MSDVFTGIEHLAIAARSPEALSDFYTRALGFRVQATFDNPDGQPKTYMLRLGNGPMLEIFPADRERAAREKQNVEPGIVHVAVLVSDFDEAARRLSQTAARPEGEERPAAKGGRVRFYRDVEGNLFHILWRPEPL